ncbi:MAG: hypothetical protein KZQ93_11620 [Candidatus Thiodiazotropha sp. (ex Monitilora ramsayi)]|nr:hypothetical protein [Candidatus Thiodiazotropha sp. (ex Monitilora ramsayi)]
MDTKRHKDEASIKQAALSAKAIIDEWQPDVVITADDNAAKYVIATYYRDASIPFVFCGINWSIEEYEFPYTNTTGIVEVAPIGLLLVKVVNILGGADSAVYIGADTLTERKNLQRFATAAHDFEITLKSHLVGTSSDWMKAYKAAQNHDFLIIGSNSGINDWDNTDIKEFVQTHTRRLSATNHGWMLPYTILGFTKVPEEHGVWAGKAAIAILNGTRPNDIPIVSNRRWDLWINDVIVKSSGIEIPDTLARIAKKASDQNNNRVRTEPPPSLTKE